MQIKSFLVLSALALGISSAYAGNCGNGVGDGNAECAAGVVGGNGGAGGQGGVGGNGGNSNVTVTNANNVTNTSNSNSSSNSNSGSASFARGGNATGGNSTSNATGGNATGGNAQGGAGGNAAGGAGGTATTGAIRNDNASRANSSTGDVAVNTVINNRRSAASASAPALVASNGTCMGSTSAGMQGAGFGASFGGTWTDQGCDRRYNAQTLQNMGLDRVAVALMCQDTGIREAMQMAGMPCPKMSQEYVVEAGGPTDQVVRARLGLQPIQ
jgi:hypothetical protein